LLDQSGSPAIPELVDEAFSQKGSELLGIFATGSGPGALALRRLFVFTGGTVLPPAESSGPEGERRESRQATCQSRAAQKLSAQLALAGGSICADVLGLLERRTQGLSTGVAPRGIALQGGEHYCVEGGINIWIYV
jgi:hypothetical protein